MIEIWRFLLFFPSLLAIETLQNHFIFDFLILFREAPPVKKNKGCGNDALKTNEKQSCPVGLDGARRNCVSRRRENRGRRQSSSSSTALV
jgi:hypothetical protein